MHLLDVCRAYGSAAQIAFQRSPSAGAEGYIDADHERIARAPLGRMGRTKLVDLGIDGYLWPEEAEGLYRLAYEAPGDVLDLGTFRGLSAYVIATALANRGHGRLLTCDHDPAALDLAKTALRFHRGRPAMTFHLGDAAALVSDLIKEGRRFGLIFVSLGQDYRAVAPVAQRTHDLLMPGGVVAMHDYSYPMTFDPGRRGVLEATRDHIRSDPRFEALPLVAATGFWRRRAQQAQ